MCETLWQGVMFAVAVATWCNLTGGIQSRHATRGFLHWLMPCALHCHWQAQWNNSHSAREGHVVEREDSCVLFKCKHPACSSCWAGLLDLVESQVHIDSKYEHLLWAKYGYKCVFLIVYAPVRNMMEAFWDLHLIRITSQKASHQQQWSNTIRHQLTTGVYFYSSFVICVDLFYFCFLRAMQAAKVRPAVHKCSKYQADNSSI